MTNQLTFTIVKREGYYYIYNWYTFEDRYFKKRIDAYKWKNELIKKNARKEFVKATYSDLYNN